MINIKKLFIGLLISILIIPLFNVNLVKAELDIEAKSVILIDNNSGKIIYNKNIDQPLPPASMTKMMTEYIVLDYINDGKINWDDIVTASDYVGWLGSTGGSAVYLVAGEKHTVADLFDAMAVASANDATVALAEYVAKTETEFVKLMNEKAQELGMERTHFLTSTGYPADELGEYQPNISGSHVMSARDAAILGWHLINDFPQSLEINGQASIEFREGVIFKSWNFMLPGLVFEYEGVDGLKTGHTSQAGYCFTATAKRNNIRLISVIFGSDTEIKRFNETEKLLDFGFDNYETIRLINAKEPIAGFEKITIENGKAKEVAVAAKNSFNIIVKNGERDLYIPKITLNDTITAPIKSGDTIGYISYDYQGEDNYEYLNDFIKSTEKVALIAIEDVEKASWVRLFFRKISVVTNDVFSTITEGIKNIF